MKLRGEFFTMCSRDNAVEILINGDKRLTFDRLGDLIRWISNQFIEDEEAPAGRIPRNPGRYAHLRTPYRNPSATDEALAALPDNEPPDEECTHIERMETERSQLGTRIVRLGTFITSRDFVGLSEDEQIDLVDQLRYMKNYFNILNRRISRPVGGSA